MTFAAQLTTAQTEKETAYDLYGKGDNNRAGGFSGGDGCASGRVIDTADARAQLLVPPLPVNRKRFRSAPSIGINRKVNYWTSLPSIGRIAIPSIGNIVGCIHCTIHGNAASRHFERQRVFKGWSPSHAFMCVFVKQQCWCLNFYLHYFGRHGFKVSDGNSDLGPIWLFFYRFGFNFKDQRFSAHSPIIISGADIVKNSRYGGNRNTCKSKQGVDVSLFHLRISIGCCDDLNGDGWPVFNKGGSSNYFHEALNQPHLTNAPSLRGPMLIGLADSRGAGFLDPFRHGVKIGHQRVSEVSGWLDFFRSFKIPVIIMHGKVAVILNNSDPVQHGLGKQFAGFKVFQLMPKHFASNFFLDKGRNGAVNGLSIATSCHSEGTRQPGFFGFNKGSFNIGRTKFRAVRFWRDRQLAHEQDIGPVFRKFGSVDAGRVIGKCEGLRASVIAKSSPKEQNNETLTGLARPDGFMRDFIGFRADIRAQRNFEIMHIKAGVHGQTIGAINGNDSQDTIPPRNIADDKRPRKTVRHSFARVPNFWGRSKAGTGNGTGFGVGGLQCHESFQLAQPHLTNAPADGMVALQQGKCPVVGIGILSVIWRSEPRRIKRGFSMVGRMEAPSGAPFPDSGNANSVRPATRDWHRSGWVHLTIWRPIMAQIVRADSVLITQNLTTTSLIIADKFGKRHDHVIRAIEALEIPDKYRLPNFGEMVVTRANPSNGAPIKSKAYELTRDGFALLVMGFTGKAAMAWKIRFLEAFNAMEAELSAPKLPPLPPRKVAPCDRAAALEHLIRRLRDHHPTITYAIALDREDIADELDRLTPAETPKGKTNVRAHLRKLPRKGAV